VFGAQFIRSEGFQHPTGRVARAPNEKFYVCGDSEAICLPNGSLRYFETEREAWAFLTDCDRTEIGKIAA
jgi:hypothetical protein